MDTLKQIKGLATATDNLYLLHLANKLEKEMKEKIQKTRIDTINDIIDLPF